MNCIIEPESPSNQELPVFMSGKALNKQEMDSIDLAKFVFAFAVIHIHAGGGRSYIRF